MSRPSDELLKELRPVAFALAYRMLGGVTEARTSCKTHSYAH